MADDRVRMVLDRYNEGTRDIQDLQQQAWLARSYLAGQQWVHWQSDEVRPLPRNDNRVRATVNRIGPDSRRVIAKLTSKQLQWEVQASTPDDAARRAAALAESVLVSTHREQDWESVRQDHAWSVWEGGTALIAVDWDPKKGSPLEIEGRAKSGTGDVCLSVLGVSEIATVPGTRDIRLAPWWIRAQALPPLEVQKHYGLSKLPAADASGSHRYLRRSLSAGRRNEVTPDLTKVLTYYERPCDGDKGKVLTVVGDQIVQEADWPFPFTDRLNIAVAKAIHVPGRWCGQAVCWDAIGPQTLYNQAWSAQVEHAKRVGNVRMKSAYGEIDDPEELTDLPGEFLEYNPGIGSGPEWMSPPQIPDWLLRMPNEIALQIDHILGVHDVSRGQAPKNIESGIGLAILDENDATPIGAFARELAGCWSDVGRLVLRIYEDRVTESRSARVTEPGLPPMVEKWTGKDLLGQTDARVPLDSFTPQTKAAKQALAIEIANRYPDDIPFTVFAELAELDVDIQETVDPQIGKAQREIFDLTLGRERLVSPEDNDEVHLKEHIAYLQSQRYELLDAEFQELHQLHIAAHKVQMAEKAAATDSAAAISPSLGAVPPMIGAAPPPMDPMDPGLFDGPPPPVSEQLIAAEEIELE